MPKSSFPEFLQPKCRIWILLSHVGKIPRAHHVEILKHVSFWLNALYYADIKLKLLYCGGGTVLMDLIWRAPVQPKLLFLLLKCVNKAVAQGPLAASTNYLENRNIGAFKKYSHSSLLSLTYSNKYRFISWSKIEIKCLI